jgi:hypothetical protein
MIVVLVTDEVNKINITVVMGCGGIFSSERTETDRSGQAMRVPMLRLLHTPFPAPAALSSNIPDDFDTAKLITPECKIIDLGGCQQEL